MEEESAVKQNPLSCQERQSIALMNGVARLPDPELEHRAACGRLEDFNAFLAQVPDVPPEDYDKLK